MTRQVALCMTTLAMMLSLLAGCDDGKRGVHVKDGPPVDPRVKQQETIDWQVNHVIDLFDDGEPGKRLLSIKNAGRLVDKPGMTGEMKARMLEALKKALAAEPMSDADEETKEKIIQEGNAVVAKLEGGG